MACFGDGVGPTPYAIDAAMACSGMDVASMASGATHIRHRRDALAVCRAVDAKGRQGKGRGHQPKQKAASAACAAQG